MTPPTPDTPPSRHRARRRRRRIRLNRRTRRRGRRCRPTHHADACRLRCIGSVPPCAPLLSGRERRNATGARATSTGELTNLPGARIPGMGARGCGARRHEGFPLHATGRRLACQSGVCRMGTMVPAPRRCRWPPSTLDSSAASGRAAHALQSTLGAYTHTVTLSGEATHLKQDARGRLIRHAP